MKNKKLSLAVPVPLMNLFIVTVILALTATFIQHFVIAVMQFSSNPNLSSFYLTFLVLGLMPLVVFLVAYISFSRTASLAQRIFESLLVAISAIAAQQAVNIVVTNVFWSLNVPGGDLFGAFGLPSIVTLLVVIFCSYYLIKLRKNSTW